MSKQINPILTSTSSRFCCWEVLDKKAFGTFQQCFYLQLCWKWAAVDSLTNSCPHDPLAISFLCSISYCVTCVLGSLKTLVTDLRVAHSRPGRRLYRVCCMYQVACLASPPARLIVIWRDNICIQWPRLELTSNKNMVDCPSWCWCSQIWISVWSEDIQTCFTWRRLTLVGHHSNWLANSTELYFWYLFVERQIQTT